jgi:prepilin peptidase CpaA
LVIAVVAGLGLLLAIGCGPVASGWCDSLAGLAVATVWWLPGLWLRQLGAGDVKFAACIGLLLGAAAAFEAMLLAAAALGTMAVATRMRSRPMRSRPDPRLPAAGALCAGMLVRLGWGPIWVG